MLARWTDQPRAELIERGTRIVSRVFDTHDASGVLVRDDEVPLLGFQPDPTGSPYSVLNFLRKPDLAFFDPDGSEALRVRRRTLIPATFDIIGHGEVMARIQLRSPLRNSYRIEIGGKARWLFRTSLFTVTLRGLSSAGDEFWVQVGPGKQQWNLLLQPGTDSLPLLAALAFIHREWWCYA